MATNTDEPEVPTGCEMSSINCEPCREKSIYQSATNFCTECKEYLCDNCTDTHSTIKATKSHIPISISEKLAQEMISCEPCGTKGNKVEATNFCKICEEYLCQDCTNVHKTLKATTTHIPIAKELVKHSDEVRNMCEPCLSNEKNIVAKHYCEKCEELLCDECTLTHKVMKATKLHNPKSVSELNLNSSNKAVDNCEPCECLGKTIEAKRYCSVCEENLCNECAFLHEKQKLTRSHELINITEKQSSNAVVPQCELCKEQHNSHEAVNYCNECEEYLCKQCAEQHKAQKKTRNHTLLQIEDIEQPGTECSPCADEGIKSKADKYCKVCEDFLCQQCCGLHRRSKASKDHTLIETSAAKGIEQQCPVCVICAEEGIEAKADKYCKVCEDFLCQQCCGLHRRNKASKDHTLIEISAAKEIEQQCPMCLICAEEGIEAKADKYCKVCEDFLCQKCCRLHRRSKASKDHTLIEPSEVQTESCDICRTINNSHPPGVAFCNECKEILCEPCKTRHENSRSSRSHELVSVSVGKVQKNEQPTQCEPCALQGLSNDAIGFCLDCDNELLCDNCIQFHKMQRLTKNHNLSLELDTIETSKLEQPLNKSEPTPETDINKSGKENDVPGQPKAIDIGSDMLTITWDKPTRFDSEDYYQLSIKDLDNNKKWKIYDEEFVTSTAQLKDLKSNTKFIFRVRVVSENGEGPYSPHSEDICTTPSPGSRVVNFAKLVKEGTPSPSLYAIPLTEIRGARNENAKTRKFELGSPPSVISKEKTIMLIGATGTGKSTLVDGIVNYVLGVNWNDPFRFSIINLEAEEQERTKNQALSQTEWITCYTINPEQGSRLPYRLHIIDTPGFGDTRGLARDQEIVGQIRQLFSETGSKGVSLLDAVCFLIKAPDARLTTVQRYIFQSVMSLFGKDIEKNICSLVTFADGIDPPVLAALAESGLPFGKSFTFNNSGLLAKNVDTGSTSLAPMFWDMGSKSFREFFNHLDFVETKSLQLTKDVLDDRNKLETIIKNLQPKLDAGLSKVNQLKQEIRIFEENKTTIESNKNFEYEVTETQQQKRELPRGRHTTNCTHCHYTCHESCVYANNDEKKKCCAMDGEGNCKYCPDKCNWTIHANTPYIFDYVEVKKKKTYAEMQQKYQDATGKLLSQEQVLGKMAEELDVMIDTIEEMMLRMKDCNERLAAIALRPNPLSVTEHIDLMIEAEKMEKRDDFMQRIKTLNEFRRRAQISAHAEQFNQQAHTTMSAAGKNRGVKKKDEKSFFRRIKAVLGF